MVTHSQSHSVQSKTVTDTHTHACACVLARVLRASRGGLARLFLHKSGESDVCMFDNKVIVQLGKFCGKVFDNHSVSY
jgi:hypothetical protein